jgi:hypothetical protein
MGGNGAEREASLASGLNALSKLQRCGGLRVEPMLLAPLHSSTGEQGRRAELLRCGAAAPAGLLLRAGPGRPAGQQGGRRRSLAGARC